MGNFSSIKSTFSWIFFVSRRFAKVDRKGSSAVTTALASLGICFGVMTLITVISVMNGFQHSFIDVIMEISSYHIRVESVVELVETTKEGEVSPYAPTSLVATPSPKGQSPLKSPMTSSEPEDVPRLFVEKSLVSDSERSTPPESNLSLSGLTRQSSSDEILRPSQNDDFLQFCQSEKSIRSVTPFYEAQSLMVGSSGKEAAAMIKAVPTTVREDDAGFKKHVNMISGSFDIEGENSIVIGTELARRTGARLGSKINLYALSGGSDVDLFSSERVFTVTGIFHTGYSDINASFAFINLDDGKKYFGSGARLLYGVKLFDENDDAKEIARIATQFPSLKTESWKEYNRAFFGALQVEKNMLMVLVFLIFVVVAINIFNGMRRMVYERREEISVLSAFGGKKRSIQSIFVTQGLLTGVSGAIPGAALGLFLSINMDTVFLLLSKLSYYASLLAVMIANPANGDLVRENPMFMLYASIPPKVFTDEVVMISLFGIGASLLASFMASRGVLKMTVVEVMRDE